MGLSYAYLIQVGMEAVLEFFQRVQKTKAQHTVHLLCGMGVVFFVVASYSCLCSCSDIFWCIPNTVPKLMWSVAVYSHGYCT